MACVIDGGTVLSLTVSVQATWGHSRARGHCRGEGTVIPNFRTKQAFAEGSIDGSLFQVMGGPALSYNFLMQRVLFGVYGLELI